MINTKSIASLHRNEKLHALRLAQLDSLNELGDSLDQQSVPFEERKGKITR